MKRIVWKYGLISGSVLVALGLASIPLYVNGVIGFDNGQIVGYSTMILAFLLVFFGIRSYREDVGGGSITFGRAFKVGILITLVTCAMYVVAWEIVHFGFIPDFSDKYAAFTLQQMRSEGASPAEITEATKKMERFKELYANPLFNAAVTFMEVFPVGLIITLVSAAILRKSAPEEPRAENIAARA